MSFISKLAFKAATKSADASYSAFTKACDWCDAAAERFKRAQDKKLAAKYALAQSVQLAAERIEGQADELAERQAIERFKLGIGSDEDYLIAEEAGEVE